MNKIKNIVILSLLINITNMFCSDDSDTDSTASSASQGHPETSASSALALLYNDASDSSRKSEEERLREERFREESLLSTMQAEEQIQELRNKDLILLTDVVSLKNFLLELEHNKRGIEEYISEYQEKLQKSQDDVEKAKNESHIEKLEGRLSALQKQLDELVIKLDKKQRKQAKIELKLRSFCEESVDYQHKSQVAYHRR